MSKLVTIYGGSGFVGRYIARRMAKEGWRVRVAVRRPDEALFTRTYGAVGQVQPVLCNIRDDLSVRAAMAAASSTRTITPMPGGWRVPSPVTLGKTPPAGLPSTSASHPMPGISLKVHPSTSA